MKKTVELEIVVNHPAGLHMRPAALFVQTAAKYKADIQICNATRASSFQNAKSTIAVMMLRVTCGDRIRVQANGPDANEAITALRQLVENDFAV